MSKSRHSAVHRRGTSSELWQRSTGLIVVMKSMQLCRDAPRLESYKGMVRVILQRYSSACILRSVMYSVSYGSRHCASFRHLLLCGGYLTTLLVLNTCPAHPVAPDPGPQHLPQPIRWFYTLVLDSWSSPSGAQFSTHSLQSTGVRAW